MTRLPHHAAAVSTVLQRLGPAARNALFESTPRQVLCSVLDEVARPLTDPYLAIDVALALLRPEGDRRLRVVLAQIRRDDALRDANTGRRIPFSETASRLVGPLATAHGLDDAAVEVLRFVVNLSFEYPGVVGSPVAPFALKPESARPKVAGPSVEEVLDMQRRAGPDGLNTAYLVSQMKGGMSVDFGIGCPLMCAYCYRREGDTVEGYLGNWTPVGFLDPAEAVSRLLAHPWFTPHVTPVGLHMSTSEAFIPQNWPRTIGALRALDELGLTNRVSCITKYSLSDDQIGELEALRNVDLDINVCYAAMPEDVEPPHRRKRIDFLTRALRSSLRVVAYYRPIAEGLNTSDEHIRNVWQTFRNAGAPVVVLGGLKFSDDHVRSFLSYGLPLPDGSFTPGKKLLTTRTEQRIMQIYDEVYADTPPEQRPAVVKRSSCGRVVVRGSRVPDYNAHFDLPDHNCRLACPLAQHRVCAAATPPAAEQVRHLLERIGQPDTRIDITTRSVIVHAPLTPFERTFLRQNLLYPVHTAAQFTASLPLVMT